MQARDNGYILMYRKMMKSSIWKKPPLYLKVWQYLLFQAQHTPYKQLERGQLFTSISEIQNECSYMIGFRKVKPSKDQVFKVIDWLRSAHESNHEGVMEQPMIATTKATHGMLVTICNYDDYQLLKLDEANDESDDEGSMKELRKKLTANNINEECKKNDKKEKKNIYKDLPVELHQPLADFIEMRNKIKKPPTDKALQMILDKLEELSKGDIATKIKILQQSTMNCWQGVFELKESKYDKGRNNMGSTPKANEPDIYDYEKFFG